MPVVNMAMITCMNQFNTQKLMMKIQKCLSLIGSMIKKQYSLTTYLKAQQNRTDKYAPLGYEKPKSIENRITEPSVEAGVHCLQELHIWAQHLAVVALTVMLGEIVM